MAIADRINEMYNHVGDAYDILELAGTNLSNLFNENVEQGAIGSYVGNTYENSKEDSATRIRTVNLIQLDKTKSYTISVKSGYSFAIFTFNDEKKFYDGGHAIWSSNEITITNIPYIALSFKKSSEANIVPSEIDDIQVMLNEGTIALPYVKSVDKNLINLAPTWKERLLYFINNGTDVVWNNWDKVTGEGTTLTLNNTEEAPMKINLKGNTSQATTTGKNLAKENIISVDRYNFLLDSIELEANKTYTFSFIPTNNNIGFNIRLNSNGGTIIKQYQTATKDQRYTTTFTLNENGKLYINNYSNGFYAKDIMIEQNNQATSYEPYTNGASPNPDYPQDIHVVSGDNSINVVGKNLFNKDFHIINGSFINGSGGISSDSTLSYQDYFIEVEQNTEYTISSNVSTIYRIAKYDSSKNFINRPYNENASTSYTINTGNAKYIKMAGTLTTALDSLQIEKGSSATTYEPYQGNTYPVNLPVENLWHLDNATNNGVTLTNNDDGSITLNGTCTSTNQFRTTFDTPLSSDTYTLSFVSSVALSTGSLYVRTRNSDGVLAQNLDVKVTNANQTVTSDIKYLDITIINGVTYNNVNLKIQFEKGSKANSYTPYGTTPIELCKIGTYQDSIKKSKGINLFDKGNVTDGGFYADHYISNASWCYFNTSSLKAGETYFTNQRAILSFYNGTTNISYIDKNNASFMVPPNTTNVYISTLITNKDTLQINEGSTALPYEPYGTGWYVKKEIGKVVLNGSEDIGWAEANNNTFRFVIGISSTNIIKVENANTISVILSDKFVAGSRTLTYTRTQCICYGMESATSYKDFIIYCEETKNMTTEQFATWLSNNNVTVYYVLATPTYTEITGELLSQLNALAKSYASQTNISQESNDLPFIINATALKEME